MRRPLRTAPRAAGLALVLSASLALTACAARDAGGETETSADPAASESEPAEEPADSGDLAITPLVQIDSSGEETTVEASGEPADPAGDGTAVCDPVSLAMAGALTGPNAALGINIENGIKLAIEQHNAANPDCQVELKSFDTEGSPDKAPAVATQIINDASVIGLIGPAFSGETKATGQAFFDAGLLSLTPSATNPDLTTNGWTHFFRGLANDAVQGPSVGAYLAGTAGFTNVCVIEDDSDYGVGLAEQVTAGLGDAANPDCAAKVKTGDKDFSATVQIIADAAPDAVFYSGYYAEAAPFAAQLRDGGVEAVFVSADGVNDPQFVEQAGSAAAGALLSCPCGPAPEEFATAYEELNGAAPGTYSVEGYDLATILLAGIDSGVTDRAGLIDWVANYSGTGLARDYEWDETGELASALIWIYEVQ